MNKIKKLEKEIQELKDLVLQLQSQVIALQARNPLPFVILPQPHALPSPGIQPPSPVTIPWWTPTDRPYIGDLPSGWQGSPTITCDSKAEISGCNNSHDSRCC